MVRTTRLDIVSPKIAQETKRTAHAASFGVNMDQRVVGDDIWDTLLRGIETAQCVKRKADWAIRLISSEAAFAEQLVAMGKYVVMLFERRAEVRWPSKNDQGSDGNDGGITNWWKDDDLAIGDGARCDGWWDWCLIGTSTFDGKAFEHKGKRWRAWRDS